MDESDIRTIKEYRRQLDSILGDIREIDRIRDKGITIDEEQGFGESQQELQDTLVELLYHVDDMIDDSGAVDIGGRGNTELIDLPNGPPERDSSRDVPSKN